MLPGGMAGGLPGEIEVGVCNAADALGPHARALALDPRIRLFGCVINTKLAEGACTGQSTSTLAETMLPDSVPIACSPGGKATSPGTKCTASAEDVERPCKGPCSGEVAKAPEPSAERGEAAQEASAGSKVSHGPAALDNPDLEHHPVRLTRPCWPCLQNSGSLIERLELRGLWPV